jgi:predicted RNase H-like nuclease (RuvC/YqgF family)
MTDRVEALRQAAQARRSATLRRAQNALHALVASGAPVTLARLAKAAKVSRSWLYRPDELRAEVHGHRGTRPAKPQPRLRDHSATVESLRQQLHAYREEIARLRAENRALDDQLSRRRGAERADNVTRPRPSSATCPQRKGGLPLGF